LPVSDIPSIFALMAEKMRPRRVFDPIILLRLRGL
jgi:hypothetical protein